MAQKWSNKYQRKPGRWVFEPTDEYRQLGREIHKAVREVWRPPSYFYHLRDGGHISALGRHAKKKYFVRFDIEDFFGRVTQTRITRCLKQYFSYQDSRRMALDSTVRHPTEEGRWILPYGFVQSPILASLALSKSRLGAALEKLHKKRAFAVSVYVDDIILSHDQMEVLATESGLLVAAAEKSRFDFNPEKSEGPSESITAFNIQLAHENLEILAARMERFSAQLAGDITEQQRRGIVGYVNSVNEVQGKSLEGSS